MMRRLGRACQEMRVVFRYGSADLPQEAELGHVHYLKYSKNPNLSLVEILRTTRVYFVMKLWTS